MRKTAFLALLCLSVGLISPPAIAGDTTITATCAASSCTGTAFASLTATDGAFLGDMKSFRITICAPSGAVLAGAGTLEIGYLSPLATYTDGAALWSRNVGLTLSVTATTRCETFPDQKVLAERGRLYVRANAVTLGTAVTPLSIFIEKGSL